MVSIPVDSTLAFLREGYPFASSRFEALGEDVFTTRLVLRPVTFLRGEEAAAMFYGGDRFTRQGAMPATVQHLLQDKGSRSEEHTSELQSRGHLVCRLVLDINKMI